MQVNRYVQLPLPLDVPFCYELVFQTVPRSDGTFETVPTYVYRTDPVGDVVG